MRRDGLVVEWPTLLLLLATYLLWIVATTYAAALWLPLGVGLAAVAMAQFSSLQHEVLHGHPFRSRVLNEARIVACAKCGKPLGTEQMIGAMLARLAGHSMFAAPGALDRLKMCADCRVVDLWQSEQHPDVRDL